MHWLRLTCIACKYLRCCAVLSHVACPDPHAPFRVTSATICHHGIGQAHLNTGTTLSTIQARVSVHVSHCLPVCSHSRCCCLPVYFQHNLLPLSDFYATE